MCSQKIKAETSAKMDVEQVLSQQKKNNKQTLGTPNLSCLSFMPSEVSLQGPRVYI